MPSALHAYRFFIALVAGLAAGSGAFAQETESNVALQRDWRRYFINNPLEVEYRRLYIAVPASKQAENQRIELYVTQTVSADACNTISLVGIFRRVESADSEVYAYRSGGALQTAVGCGDKTIHDKQLRSESSFVPYSPVTIVDVPKDFQLHYRIWGPTSDERDAKGIGE